MQNSIHIGDRVIVYNFERKNVKNINLRIKPDGSINVSANYRITAEVVNRFVQSKIDYIVRKLDYYKKNKYHFPVPAEYADGDMFSFLGNYYQLKVVQNNSNCVEKTEKLIVLKVKNPFNLHLRKSTIDCWKKTQCEKIVGEICQEVFMQFEKYKVRFPQIRFYKMTSQWGNCRPQKGILTFNTALIHVPLTCIEYVVTHEFIHFLQPDHSKRFYQFLNFFMPDWKQRREILNRYLLVK